MKCQKHGKEVVVNCTWCGKQLCQKCITLSDGKKVYCDVCANSNVGKMVREKQLRMIKDMEE